MKMQYFHCLIPRRSIWCKQRLYRSTCIVGAHGIVRPVNIPLNDAEQQKMKASADELQAIIDEAWKNPDFQEASKTNLTLVK